MSALTNWALRKKIDEILVATGKFMVAKLTDWL